MRGVWMRAALAALLICLVQAGAAFGQTTASVVALYADTADGRHKQGSAFAVGPGLFATSYHLIRGAARIRLVAQGGAVSTTEVAVRGVDPQGDVAVLEAPQLASLRPIPLSDRVPATTETLLMSGWTYGIQGPGVEVGTLTEGLVPVSEFDDREQRPLFTDPPDVAAMLLVGVVRRGDEGGPLLDDQGRALGVVSASLDDMAGYGWAMPVGYLTPLLAGRSVGIGAFAWPASPYAGPDVRLERYVIEDAAAAADLAAFPDAAARLREANQALATHIGSRSFAMTELADRLDAALAGSPTLAAVNAAGMREMAFLPGARAELVATAQALEARAGLGRQLRRTVGRLDGLEGRADLDEVTRARVRADVRGITGVRNAAAASDYADAAALAADLRALAGHAGRFASLADAQDFAARLRRASGGLQAFDGADFSVRMSQEDSYFSRAERVLRAYAGAIVYRPAP